MLLGWSALLSAHVSACRCALSINVGATIAPHRKAGERAHADAHGRSLHVEFNTHPVVDESISGAHPPFWTLRDARRMSICADDTPAKACHGGGWQMTPAVEDSQPSWLRFWLLREGYSLSDTDTRSTASASPHDRLYFSVKALPARQAAILRQKRASLQAEHRRLEAELARLSATTIVDMRPMLPMIPPQQGSAIDLLGSGRQLLLFMIADARRLYGMLGLQRGKLRYEMRLIRMRERDVECRLDEVGSEQLKLPDSDDGTPMVATSGLVYIRRRRGPLVDYPLVGSFRLRPVRACGAEYT
eukprot:5112608-Prymnesium_polylepis.1